jgi:O-antigen ligase
MPSVERDDFMLTKSERLIKIAKLTDSQVSLLQNGVYFLIALFFFLNPYPYSTAIKEICYYLAVSVCLALVSFKKFRLTVEFRFLLPMVLFTGWVFVGLFFAIDKTNSISDFFGNLIKYVCLFLIVASMLDTRRKFVIFAHVWILSSTVFAIVGFVVFYIIEGHPLSARFGFAGLVSINSIGFITLPALALCLQLLTDEEHSHQGWIWLPAALALILISLLTQTKAIAISIVLLLIVLLYSRKIILIGVLAVMVAALLIFPVKERLFATDVYRPSNDERIGVWHIYTEMIREQPSWVGKGYGMQIYWRNDVEADYQSIKSRLPATYNISRMHPPHNLLLDITFRTGFVGLGAFLLMVGSFFHACIRMIRSGRDEFTRSWSLTLAAIFTTYLLQAMFSDITYSTYLIIFFAIMGMIAALWHMSHCPGAPPAKH